MLPINLKDSIDKILWKVPVEQKIYSNGENTEKW